GICYELGHGVEKDFPKAIEYYQKAAEKGYAPAQYNLGVCYYNGNGVEKSIENAKKWFELAAPQGHQKAIEALEIINR
ncbi:MAG: sel1 repeat family protein, partial [Muribaculaceae bacterium]|nr:sel1 repeat family protein [Muribaculaceae bacterium]